ncbi:MAG TPA: hypothetical protein VIV60_12410 [Polyangiaceae bacterium]
MNAKTREPGSELEDHPTDASGSWRLSAPAESDIRALGNSEPESESSIEATAVRHRHAPIFPAPADFSLILAQIGDGLPREGDAFRALQLGDLPLVISILTKENGRLCAELDATRADFDALVEVNRSIQGQMEDALSVADDQRVALLEELERARDQLLAMDTLVRDVQAEYESKLLDKQQWIEDLEAEIFDVRDELAACRSQLGVE